MKMPPIPTVRAGEDHHTIFGRMLLDRWQVELGERNLDRALQAGDCKDGLSAAYLDIDKSGVVRARGLDAKIALVHQVQRLITLNAPDDALVITSGSRDDICVCLPHGDLGAITELAEQLRKLVACSRFSIPDFDEPVRVTTSVGVAAHPAPESASCLLDAARAGLKLAKVTRDCVCAGSITPTEVWVTAPAEVWQTQSQFEVAAATHVSRGAWVSEEKYGPLRYWLARRRTELGGWHLPVVYPHVDGTVAPAAKRFFDSVVAATALEMCGAEIDLKETVLVVAYQNGAPPSVYASASLLSGDIISLARAHVLSRRPEDLRRAVPQREPLALMQARWGPISEWVGRRVVVDDNLLDRLKDLEIVTGIRREFLLSEAMAFASDRLTAWCGL